MDINLNSNAEQTIAQLVQQRIQQGLKTVMPEIGDVILTSIQDRFDEQSAGTPVFPLGTQSGAWQPLAASTLKRKQGGKILMGGQNAELRKAFSYRVQENSLFLTNNRTVNGWNLFEIHQHGANAGKGGKSVIPERPMLALQQEEIDEIIQIIKEGIGG